MTTRLRIGLSSLGVAAGLTLAGLAWPAAAPPSGQEPAYHAHRAYGAGAPLRWIGRLAHDPDLQSKLGLTPEQISTLSSVASQAREKLIRSAAEVRVQRLALRDLIADAEAPRARIEQKAAELSAKRADLAKAVTGAILDARDVLGPEQRVALQGMIRERVRERARSLAERSGRGWEDAEE